MGENEVSNQSLAAKAGLAPRILSSELGPKATRSEISDVLRMGRVAMERAPGRLMESFDSPDQKVGNTTVSNSYWALRGKLHKLGIAHNDLHDHNVFIDPNSGKATAIDFGLAQKNAKAALSEALGAFSKGEFTGDFQVKRSSEFPNIGYSLRPSEMSTNLRTIRKNLSSVINFLESKGFSNDEIDRIIDSPIREPSRFYTRGIWSRLSDEDSMRTIQILYKGIE